MLKKIKLISFENDHIKIDPIDYKGGFQIQIKAFSSIEDINKSLEIYQLSLKSLQDLEKKLFGEDNGE